MKSLFPMLTGAAVAIAAPAAAQDAAGDWFGVLEVSPQAKLPLVVHIKRDDAGALTGSLDSPSQGARDLALAEVAVAGTRLSFKVPVVAGSYEGTWDEAAKSWQGTWRQSGMSWPLTFGIAPATLPEAAPARPPLPADWQLPADADIEAMIAERIAPRAGQGVVVGVLSPEGQRIVAEGPAGATQFGGDTLFEIGSISKVFTALILADMAAKGEVSLDDPAENYLPAGARLPERGRKITLRDLSMHRSGLPRVPYNMRPVDPNDPYADYTEAQMLEFLGQYPLPRDVGAQWEYSNLGVGLLGYLLGRAAGSDYATLLRERITGPLGMSDTQIVLSPELQARLAQPYDAFMRPAQPWSLPTLVAAGGIRSTARDMLKFAAAALDPASPLAPRMKLALGELMTASPGAEQGLGWFVLHPEPGRDLLFHNGGTGGFRSSLLLEPARQRAVVVLANSAAEPSGDDLAMHVLVGAPVAATPPVPPPPAPVPERAAATLPVAELDRVVGRYDFGDGVNVITREGDRLLSARAGVPTLEIYPEAPLRFFFRDIDAQLRFTTDESGQVIGMVFTMPGMERTAKRVEP